MTLTDEQIDRLRASFARLAEDREATAALFYHRLFELAPETRPLFRGDLGAQGHKLMNTLGAVVAQIHAFDALRPLLAELARRHVAYGVAPRHYPPVGEALLWMIERRTGPCAETRAAWAAAYGAISGAMIAAAYPRSGARVA